MSTFAEFCLGRHAGKKYGARDFAYHLRQVVGVLRAANAPWAVVEAGWGHDVIEDLLATREEVRAHSSHEVEELVWAVSGTGTNRAERLLSVIPKILATPGAALLKMADRYCNLVNCIEDRRWGLLATYVDEDSIIAAVFPSQDHPLRQAYDQAILCARSLLAARHATRTQRSGSRP